MTAQSAIQTFSDETPPWPRDPLGYFLEFPLRENCFPLGAPAEISTNSADVISAARQTWGSFPHLLEAEKIHVRVAVAESGRPDLPQPPVIRGQRGLIAIISDSENFGVCDVTSGFSFGWIAPATAADQGFFRYHFLNLMAGLLIAPMHYAIIHSACVALDGHGVLLCGHSNAGKSTLSFACARRGWTFVSDDAVYVPRKNPGRTVIGDPLSLRLRSDAPSLFPELRNRTVILRQNGEFGFEIATSELPGLVTAFTCNIDHLVFLNRTPHGPAKIESFPEARARRHLENVLDYTFACSPCHGGNRAEMFLADAKAREEQKVSLSPFLAGNVHELSYSDLNQAIDCLEAMVRSCQRESLCVTR